jgi:hypothetical protein
MKWFFACILAFGFSAKAQEPQARFIPVELWTGAPWDGKEELRMGPANLVFGDRAHKRITGPVQWTRPGAKEPMLVYEHTNRGKKQLFALSSRGDGLGRVYDSRYPRDCLDEVKFPLGRWKQGEMRVFDVPCNGGRSVRRIELRIEKIDFVHAGVPHSLQYHWLVDGGRGAGTDMRYIYSPGLGMVYVQGDE